MVSWSIVIARFFAFSSVLSLFGSSLFYLYGFHTLAHGALYRRGAWPHLTLLIASGLALTAVVTWLMAETTMMTGAPTDAFNIQAIWSVLTETTFGAVTALRIAFLLASLAGLLLLTLSKWTWVLQTVFAGIVLASFVLTGHGGMDQGSRGIVHGISDAAHLLAAGIWLGALLPLSTLILHAHRQQEVREAEIAYHGLDGFSGAGLTAVATLVLTGAINSWFLIGPAHWRAVFTTPYGITLLVKLGLFVGMLALAATNRFVLTPRLNTSIQNDVALHTSLKFLRRSILIETILALFVVITVSLLGMLEPPISDG